MKKALISLLTITIAVFGDLGIAIAFESGLEDRVVVCSNRDKTRILTLDYLVPGAYVPCRVLYEKPTEMPGNPEILWSAENKLGYCERQMDDFIHNKLEDQWDWQCSDQKPSLPEHQAQAQTWYVVLGRFLQTQRCLNAALVLLNQFKSNNRLNSDYLIVGESDFYTGFTNGLYIVMAGPFQNQPDAQNWAELNAVLDIVPDAYIQQATVRGSGMNSSQKWSVILGLYPNNKQGYKLANQRSYRLTRAYHRQVIVKNSELCENLVGGLIVVMMGAFDTEQQASIQKQIVKRLVPEAYIKQVTCRSKD